jgi:hypothetical protein
MDVQQFDERVGWSSAQGIQQQCTLRQNLSVEIFSSQRRGNTPPISTVSHTSTAPTSKKTHSILTASQAVDIFQHSLTKSLHSKKSAAALSRAYGVNEKTVRDIWNGRTWAEETQHLAPHRPIRLSGPPGRPRGSHDRVSRTRKPAMIVEGLSKTGMMRPPSPPCSSRDAETKQSGWRNGWGNENIEAIHDAASSALRRVAAIAADSISRRSQGWPSGISREDECASAPQEKFGSTASGQSEPGWASTWRNHPECSAHPHLNRWDHAPAAHELEPWMPTPASSDPKNMSSSWEGDGSYTQQSQLMGKWSGHYEHQQCGANGDSQAMLLLDSEAELRWAELQPPPAAFAAGAVQAGQPGSEGHRGWLREHCETSLQDVNCERDSSTINWGAKGQQAHAKAVGRPAEYVASGWSSGWDYAGCGGCGDGSRSIESESAQYTWADRQDPSWGCGREGGLAGAVQSRSHEQWGTVGHQVEGSAAGVNMSMPWVEGSFGSGAGNASADASGWRQGSNSWNWGGRPCNVSGVRDAGRTSSRSCPNVSIHGEGIQVDHGRYDSYGVWLPALDDQRWRAAQP